MKVSEQNEREIRAWDAAYAKGFAEGRQAASLPGAGAGEPVAWRLVPIEPTELMGQIGAGQIDRTNPHPWDVASNVYHAMLAAAPASPALASMPGEAWQPMESAPKAPQEWGKGPRLLMTDGELVSVGFWDKSEWDWLCEAEIQPTDGPGAVYCAWDKPPIGWRPVPRALLSPMRSP